MAIIQNYLYQLTFDQRELTNVLLTIDKNQFSLFDHKKLKNVQIQTLQNKYLSLYENIKELKEHLNIKDHDIHYQKEDINIDEVTSYIFSLKDKIEKIEDVITQINKEKEENKEAITLLNYLKKEKLSVDHVKDLQYITLRFGKLPVSMISNRKYYNQDHYIVKELDKENDDLYIIYCALNKDIAEVDDIFSAMGFKEIILPDFAHGKIDEAIDELKAETNAMDQYIEDLLIRIEHIVIDHRKKIIQLYKTVNYLKTLYENMHDVVEIKDKMALYLYSPLGKEELEDYFLNVHIVEMPLEVSIDHGIDIPVTVKNNRIIQPFENLISFKAYDHFDPTMIVSLCLMIMMILIGDLLSGVIVIIVSMFVNKKHGDILKRLSAGLLIGGLLSGTVGYSMSLYPAIVPLYHIPLMIRILTGIALNIGVYTILMIVKYKSRKLIVKGGA